MDRNEVTKRIIGCAVEVHRELGPGLLEAVYESALSIELAIARLQFEQQLQIPAKYKNRPVGHYRVDFVVERAVVVEVKSVDRLDPVFESQILTYMRVTGVSLGLLINFNSRLVTEGVRRFIL